MTSNPSSLDSVSHYNGSDHVVFGNGDFSHISHIGTSQLSPHLKLSDVLIVPSITKNLLSISKLTQDSPVDVLFSNPFFQIQNRKTKEILAKGKCDNGLYVLKHGHQVFLATLHSSRSRVSFELWHTRL